MSPKDLGPGPSGGRPLGSSSVHLDRRCYRRSDCYRISRCSLVILCAAALIAVASGATSTGYVDDKVQNYLMNFGYLPQSNSETGNLRSEDQLREAIISLQEFGHIPITGAIDEKTKELLSKPRCGLPDEVDSSRRRRHRRFVQQGATWNHTDLTWSLQRQPANLDSQRVRGELARALAVWSDHSKLTFREIRSDKADIVVAFAKRYHDDNYPFDGKGQILAHAFFPGSGRGGDAHFDEEETWLLRNANEDDEGTSLFAVAAHEFGHSLGLSHSSVQGALMYPWYQGLKPNFQLPDDDRLGIQNMYGSKEERMWGKIPDNLPTEPPRVYTTQRPKIQPRPRWPSRYPDSQPGYPNRPPAWTTTSTTARPHNHPERRHPYYPDRPPLRTTTTARPQWRHHEYDPDRRTDKHYPNVKTVYTDRGSIPENPPPRSPEVRPYNPTGQPHYPRHPDYPHYPDVKPEYPRKPHSPKKTYPAEKPRTPEKPSMDRPDRPLGPPPDTCNTNYDAVALIRGEVFIFKSQYLWRIGDSGVMEGFPTSINRMWKELPEDLTHVDAVYERPDGKIVFFIGKLFYLFNANNLVQGYPRPITDLGLPSDLEHLNAAMVWGHNGKTYFYNETMYWKFDEEEGRIELDYPRDMSMWKGVGYNVDSVFQWKDGKTYFFKGKGYWKFNDLKMRVENERQHASGPFWMGCPSPRSGEHFAVGNKEPYRSLPPSPTSGFQYSGAPLPSGSLLSLLVMVLVLLYNIDLT